MFKLYLCHLVCLGIGQILLLNQNGIAQISVEHFHDGVVIFLVTNPLMAANLLNQLCSRGKYRLVADDMNGGEEDIRRRHKPLKNLYGRR